MQKQKVLEQVLPAPKGEEKELVARTVRIGRTEYLIADFFMDGVVERRIALTEKDYLIYEYESDAWTKSLPYTAWGYQSYKGDRRTKNTVNSFVKMESGDAGENIYEAMIERKQRKENRMNELEEEKKQRDISSTPELPEGFKEWAYESVKSIPHMLLYKRKHKKATIWCGACGNESEIRTTDKWDPFDIGALAPKAGNMGLCPKCKEDGIYYHEGRKSHDSWTKYVYLFQKTTLDEIVIRMFEVNRYERKNCEKDLTIREQIREYIGGNGVRKYFRMYGYGERWSKYNQGSYGNPWKFEDGKIYPGYLEEIRSTESFRYCDVQQYMKISGENPDTEWWRNKPEAVKLEDVLETYINVPQIEFLMKSGKEKLIGSIVRGQGRKYVNRKGKNMADFLQIRKERVKTIGNIDTHFLEILQAERRWDEHFTDDEIEKMKEFAGMYKWEENLDNIMKHMSFKKAMNHIELYLKGEFKGSTRSAVLVEYDDYLKIREELGYDMTNTVYLFPKNLGETHAKLITERENTRDKNYILEKMEKYNNIPKRYKSLQRKYGYEKDGYVIRPAKDAKEIIMEGRILHHCVGGDNYLSKHNKGTSAILFLRRTNSVDLPYITIEMRENKIVQWYGAHDRKPDEEHMQQYLDTYKEYLEKRGEKKHGKRSDNTGAGELQPIQTAI